MSNFAIATMDGTYTYTSRNDTPATVKQDIKNNNQYTDTQGFLRKVQVGRKRAEITVQVDDTKESIEDNILPMLTYPDSVSVTIDRNFLNRNVKTLEMVITDYNYEEIGGRDDNLADGVITLKLVEVLETAINV
jgi:hypothetical protein